MYKYTTRIHQKVPVLVLVGVAVAILAAIQHHQMGPPVGVILIAIIMVTAVVTSREPVLPVVQVSNRLTKM